MNRGFSVSLPQAAPLRSLRLDGRRPPARATAELPSALHTAFARPITGNRPCHVACLALGRFRGQRPTPVPPPRGRGGAPRLGRKFAHWRRARRRQEQTRCSPAPAAPTAAWLPCPRPPASYPRALDDDRREADAEGCGVRRRAKRFVALGGLFGNRSADPAPAGGMGEPWIFGTVPPIRALRSLRLGVRPPPARATAELPSALHTAVARLITGNHPCRVACLALGRFRSQRPTPVSPARGKRGASLGPTSLHKRRSPVER